MPFPTHSTAPPLDFVPPFRFATVECGVYRGAYPVLRNYSFLRNLGIRCILSITPEPATFDVVEFARAEKIKLRHIQAERFKGDPQLLPTDFNEALATILNTDLHPIYVHCLDGKQVVGLVIMALRRLLLWDSASSLHEYQRFTRECTTDEVAFINDYTGGFTMPHHIPSWLWGGSWRDAQGCPCRHPLLKIRYSQAMGSQAGGQPATAATPATGVGGGEEGGSVGEEKEKKLSSHTLSSVFADQNLLTDPVTLSSRSVVATTSPTPQFISLDLSSNTHQGGDPITPRVPTEHIGKGPNLDVFLLRGGRQDSDYGVVMAAGLLHDDRQRSAASLVDSQQPHARSLPSTQRCLTSGMPPPRSTEDSLDALWVASQPPSSTSPSQTIGMATTAAAPNTTPGKSSSLVNSSASPLDPVATANASITCRTERGVAGVQKKVKPSQHKRSCSC